MTAPSIPMREGVEACPFCGAEAVPVNAIMDAGVHCTNVECRAGMVRAHPTLTPGDAMPDARAAWNRRAVTEAMVERLAQFIYRKEALKCRSLVAALEHERHWRRAIPEAREMLVAALTQEKDSPR